jgi:hypothetical protein
MVDLLGFFLPLMKTFDESVTRLPQGQREDLSEAVGEFPYPPRILNPSSNPNIAMLYGYSSAFGYVGNSLQRYNDFINVLQGAPLNVPRSASFVPDFNPNFQLLAFDAMLVERKFVPPHVKILKKVGKNRVLVPYGEIQKKIPRAFLAAAPRYFTQREDALQYVFSKQNNVQASPAIERIGSAVASAPLDANETVRFISFGMQRVVLEVRANRPRELVLCGMFERNWTARVNGRRVTIGPANYVYRAVQVPAGVSRVVFKYHPRTFYRGVAVSAVSFIILMLIGIGARREWQPKLVASGLGLLSSVRIWLRRPHVTPQQPRAPADSVHYRADGHGPGRR